MREAKEKVCAGALLVRCPAAPQILLGKRAADRASYPDVWDVPGGHCRPVETPDRALVRELEEELGVTPTAWRPLGELRGRPTGSDEPLVLHLHVVTAWTGTPRNRLPEEHEEVAWFAVEDACRLELAHPSYPEAFRRAAASVRERDDAR